MAKNADSDTVDVEAEEKPRKKSKKSGVERMSCFF